MGCKRGDDASEELRALAVREIEPSARGGFEHRLRSDEAGIEGDNGDAVGRRSYAMPV